MTLLQSAKLSGHDLHAYLKEVLDRLPIQPNSRIDELLPHNWKSVVADAAGTEATGQLTGQLTDLRHAVS